MATNSSTIIGLKSAFLRTQTRVLSQPLQAPERWKDGNADAAELPETVVKDVIREVNRLVRRHNKSAYPSLAIRHVAEQIDKLYWDAGAPILYLPNSAEPPTSIDLIGTTAIDLTSDAAISSLPESLESETQEESDTVDSAAADAYATQLAHLQELSARRAAAAAKLTRYRRLQGLLEPLREPLETVQPNLVTRDAELAREVGNAKTLSMRVTARLGAWVERRDSRDEEVDVAGREMEWIGNGKGDERERLRALLE